MKTKNALSHAYSMFGYRKSEEIELYPRGAIKREIRAAAMKDIEFKDAIFELGVNMLADKVKITASKPLPDFMMTEEREEEYKE